MCLFFLHPWCPLLLPLPVLPPIHPSPPLVSLALGQEVTSFGWSLVLPFRASDICSLVPAATPLSRQPCCICRLTSTHFVLVFFFLWVDTHQGREHTSSFAHLRFSLFMRVRTRRKCSENVCILNSHCSPLSVPITQWPPHTCSETTDEGVL